nr:phage tail protein [Moraxella sp. CTOTU48268]
MIKGAKAGQQQQRQPNIAKDSAASISYLKILYGLSEGEISGLANGAKSIYLDDTPLLDDSGNPNFKDDNGNLAVTWDFRSGTNDQDYIKGFPSVENETNINVELKGGTPYVKTVTNGQLSAVRLRLSWGALRKQETNGDVNGITIEYAIDLSTDGGAYQTVLNTQVSDKTSAKYERSHRIDLPRGNTWNIRVRRLTPNATSDLISDKMYVDAITEIIDAKLRYPNTAMLGLQYNAATFSNVAKLAVRCRGKIISVPSNYDPVTRTYNGIWDGTFKQAYSNNPAWVYYDICTQWRYGLGDRLTSAMIDKWSLYALAQYCDQQVSDGKGGNEPRFSVNVYLQAQQDAFSVLQSLASIFRAMSYWQGEQIVLDADLPKDPVYTFSRANVVGGEFSYTGTRARDRHTIAKVAWDNPEQKFKTEYEFVRDEAAIAKYGVKVLDLSIVGCTSQGQAQRAGLWALKSEQLETRTVTFKTGLDGFIPTVGSIINVSDEVLAGRANGGRVSAVSSDFLTVTLDRDTVVSAGDTLIINGNNGKAQRRIVSSVNGRDITVSMAFTDISSQNVWAVDSSDLKTMQFRVLSIKQDDVTFSITALQHEPQKYDAIDYGAIVEPTSISIIKPNVIDAPKNIAITQRNRVEQGQNIATMIVSWEQVSGAVAYDVEWRKDDGNWTKVPRTGNNSIEIDGVYSGNYLARVASVSAFDLVSNFATSMLTAVVGKLGTPPSLASLKATGILFGMQLDWLFAQGSSDTNYTEIQVASAPDTNVALLGTYAYPTNTATINGLQGNLTQYYRGRIVDKLGNVSPWTAWVKGVTSADASKVLDLLNGQITESQLYKDLGAKIDKIGTLEDGLSQEIQNRENAINASKAAVQQDYTHYVDTLLNAPNGVNERITKSTDGLTTYLKTYKDSNGNYVGGVVDEVATKIGDNGTLVTKLDGVFAQVNPEMAGSTNDLAGSDKFAGVWTEQSARIDADSSLSLKIDNLNSEFGSNQAKITSQYYTLADNLSSVASKVDLITALSDGNVAEFVNTVYTKAATNDAINSGIRQFKTDYYDKEMPLKASAKAVEDITNLVGEQNQNITAMSQKIDGVFAQVNPEMAGSNESLAGNDKQAGVWTEQSARIEGDVATGIRIDNAVSEINGIKAAIQEQELTYSNGVDALAAKITTVQGVVNGQKQSVEVIQGVGDVTKLKLETEKARNDNSIDALTVQATKLQDSITTLTKQIASLNDKRTPDNAALTDESIAKLQAARVEAQTALDAIPAQKQQLLDEKKRLDSLVLTESKIKNQYTIRLDGNNRVAGFGLALDDTNNFDFAIRADKFYIAPPEGTGNGVSPFMVLTSPQVINGTTVPVGTYIKGDLIATGSITADKIDTRGLSIRDANGNVLFGSGTALDVANITGLGGLATKDTVTTSEVTGLGSLAKVDKLTTSNITTYVDGLGVRNLLVGDAQITTANIGTAQVDTLQIAGEAVVVPKMLYNPNAIMFGKNGLVELGASSINTQGSPVIVTISMESFNFSYSYISDSADNYLELYLLLTLKRNGNTIKTYEFGSSYLVEAIPRGDVYNYNNTLAIGGVNTTLPPFLDVPPNADTRYSVEGVIMRRSNGQVWKTADMVMKGFSIFLQGVKR